MSYLPLFSLVLLNHDVCVCVDTVFCCAGMTLSPFARGRSPAMAWLLEVATLPLRGPRHVALAVLGMETAGWAIDGGTSLLAEERSQ